MSTDYSQGNQDDVGNQADEQPVHPVNLLNLPEKLHISGAGDAIQAHSPAPGLKADSSLLPPLSDWPILILQKFLNVLPFADVLQLRVLNSRTKSAIDRLLEQGHVHVAALSRYYSQLALAPNNLIFNENTQKYDLITKPIANWMDVKLTFYAVEDQRFVHFLPCLRLRGPQISELRSRCCMHLENANPLRTMKNLRTVLLCTENVRILDIFICCNYPESETEQRWANQVATFLEENPFPPLPNLVHLIFTLSTLKQFQFPSCASIIFQNFLLAYGAQLQSMDFKVQTLDQLKILQHSNAPLVHLFITIHPNSPITPTQLLLALEPFQSTLKELVWNQHCNFALIDPPPVNSPWSLVKSLRLATVYEIEYTDDNWLWLDCFPYLVQLEIGNMDEGFLLTEQERLYRSNIWSRLPKLHTLQMHAAKLTRCVYERLLVAQNPV